MPPLDANDDSPEETPKPDFRTDFVGWLDRHGQKLEPGQRVLCRVLFDRVDPIDLEDPSERAIALKMFGCERVPELIRTLGIYVAICGGRGGKSLLAAWRLVYLAHHLELKLSPGEQAYALIVAADQKLADQVLRYAIGIAREWFGDAVEEESNVGFTLVRSRTSPLKSKWEDERVRFLVVAASKGGRGQRGRACVGAVLDEAAFFRGEDSSINDKDIIDAITPRILPGGELVIITTPWAREGEVWQMYDRNFGHPVDALVAHAPTWVLRTDARILAQIERETARDPWNAAREFGAQFISRGGTKFFDPDSLVACTHAEGCAP